jgi:lysophospholipase L1-like esterase
MIDAIRAGHPDREIILQTMNPVWDAPNGNQSGTKRPNLPAYFQAYRDVAADRGLLLIDHYPNWLNIQTNNPAAFQSYTADGLHPNAAGYQAVVSPTIQAALVPEPATIATLAMASLLTLRRKR